MKPPKSNSRSTQLKQLQAQLHEITNALQQERADALNLRRRHQEEMTGLRSRLKADVVRELLPVIDNFERALKHIPKNLENDDYIQGIQGILNQFEKTLQQMGVKKIKTIGEHFNPHLHEAVSLEEGDGPHEIVSEELQAGYKLEDEVLRHAIVRVKS